MVSTKCSTGLHRRAGNSQPALQTLLRRSGIRCWWTSFWWTCYFLNAISWTFEHWTGWLGCAVFWLVCGLIGCVFCFFGVGVLGCICWFSWCVELCQIVGRKKLADMLTSDFLFHCFYTGLTGALLATGNPKKMLSFHGCALKNNIIDRGIPRLVFRGNTVEKTMAHALTHCLMIRISCCKKKITCGKNICQLSFPSTVLNAKIPMYV